MSTEAFAEGTAARHSQNSRDPFHAGGRFRGFHDSHICYGLPVCSAPCTDLTGLPANGAFYIQAFNGSVALLVVGYDYSIDWTPMLVGLSPTRLAASLAARSSPSRCGPGRNIAAGQSWDLPTSDAFLLRVTCSQTPAGRQCLAYRPCSCCVRLFPRSPLLRHAYFVAPSQTLRNRCVRFVAGVTVGSRNTCHQRPRNGLTRTGLPPFGLHHLCWRLRKSRLALWAKPFL